MLNLNTNISIETIKQSKKLQEIECEKAYPRLAIGHHTGKEFDKPLVPAPTIADIISNAEFLFKDEGKIWNENNTGYTPMFEILIMCRQNKPLSEIEKYIVNNIK